MKIYISIYFTSPAHGHAHLGPAAPQAELDITNQIWRKTDPPAERSFIPIMTRDRIPLQKIHIRRYVP